MVQNPASTPGVTLSHWCGAARRDADKRQKGVADGALLRKRGQAGRR